MDSSAPASPRVLRSRGHLLRILGLTFGIAITIGNTIGSGILLTPGAVAARLHAPWLILTVWALGGIFALFCTAAVAELGTSLPEAGGWFVYARHAFGEYGGFLIGFADWMVQSGATAYLAVAFAEFAAGLFPAGQAHKKLIAVTCLLLMMLLNSFGLRIGSQAQQITSFAKALALVAFVVACFLVVHPVAHPALAPATSQSLPSLPIPALLVAIVIALQPVIITYDGWYGAIYFTEEDQNPARNLPRSSITGILACAAIYLLVNVALLHTLPFHQLATSSMPAVDAAQRIFGFRGRELIVLLSLVTLISTINASLLITPRILFAMARDRLLPRWVTSVNSGGTPAGALLLCTATSLVLILSGSYLTLVAITSVLFVAVYLSGFLSLFVLRLRHPQLPRPFRMPGYPWTNLAITLGTAAFLIATIVADFRHALFGLAVLFLTAPLYLLMKRLRRTRDAAAALPATTK